MRIPNAVFAWACSVERGGWTVKKAQAARMRRLISPCSRSSPSVVLGCRCSFFVRWASSQYVQCRSASDRVADR